MTQMASTHNSIKKPASQDQTNVLPQFRSIVSVSSKDTDNSVDERAQAEYFKYLTTKHS